MPFPLPFIPSLSYKTAGRRFGAARDGGRRKHAGCDLIAPEGTAIVAVADGIVMQDARHFYRGTWAVAVKHTGHPGYIVRYCEFKAPTGNVVPEHLRQGAVIKAGQKIAEVGKMFVSSMLHFEMYAGMDEGDLTVRSNGPFERRCDLMDPTAFLDRLSVVVQQSHEPIEINFSGR